MMGFGIWPNVKSGRKVVVCTRIPLLLSLCQELLHVKIFRFQSVGCHDKQTGAERVQLKISDTLL